MFAPDRGHRSKRRVSASQVAVPLAVAVPVGLLGARGVGTGAALAIAAATAVVTLFAVLVWRATLPHLVSVTVSPTQVTYRRYGRKSSVERAGQTRAAVHLVVMQAGLESPYLIASCGGDGFVLNTDMWAQDDLQQIANALSIEAGEVARTPLTAAQVRHQYPCAMPFHMAHPHRTAVIALVVAVPLVAVVMWVAGFWTEDDVDSAAVERRATATQVAELPTEVARRQDDQLAQAQSILSPASTWERRDPATDDCQEADGWQRVVDTQSADGSSRPAPGIDLRQALTDLAGTAGMTAIVDQVDPGGAYELRFQHADTGAFLHVRGDESAGSDLSIVSGSACVVTP